MKKNDTGRNFFCWSRNRFTNFVTFTSLMLSATFCQAAKSGELPVKFFPYGVLHSVRNNFTLTKDWLPDFRRQANTWGQSNVNTVCVYGIGAPPNVQGTLPILGNHDIKVWGSLYMPLAYKPKCPQIVEKTRIFLEKYKNDDRIYAFAIKDEPKKQHYKLYSESVDFIKKYDPKHKIISIFCHNHNVIPYLGLMDTIAIDIYPIRDRVRDPWWIADQCVDMCKIIKGTNKNFVVMPPAHTFYSKDYVGRTGRLIKDIDTPTVEEFRLMSWLSIANGADGVVFFLYKWPSAWLKSLKGDIGKGFVNMIGTSGELWKEFKSIGWQMRPVGQIIAGSQVVPVKGMLVVDNKYFKLPKSDFAKIDYPRKKREVISIYSRQHKGRAEKYYFVVNNDLKHSQKVKLKLTGGQIKNPLDLQNLQQLIPDSNGMVEFTLAPGDAKILLTGSTDIQKQAKRLVIRERVKMLRNKLKAKVEALQKAAVIPENSSFARQLKNMDKNTLEQLNSLDARLDKTAAADKSFSRNMKLLAEASDWWTRADDILEKRTIKIRDGKAAALDPVCKEMMACAKKYYSLKTYLTGWKKPKQKINYPAELTTLIAKLKKLNQRLDIIVSNVPEDVKGVYSERYK